jgi:pilus assembly protein FimV
MRWAKDPSRQEVRQKLLELYAARPDTANFEKLAREFHVSTDGKGQAWAKVAAMGLGIDPTNALYQLAADELAAGVPAQSSDGLIDLDQELFGAAEPAAAIPAPEPAAAEQGVDDPLRAALFEEEAVAEKPAEVSNMLDFDLDADWLHRQRQQPKNRQRNRKPRPICSISISIWMAVSEPVASKAESQPAAAPAAPRSMMDLNPCMRTW